MSYDNSNRVALWFNDKREKATHPHLKGQGERIGELWASAWFDKEMDPEDAKALMGIIKRHNASSKKPFLSISLQPKESHTKPGEDVPTREYSTDFDNEPPF